MGRSADAGILTPRIQHLAERLVQMQTVINFLNNRYLIAIIVLLFLIGVARKFATR